MSTSDMERVTLRVPKDDLKEIAEHVDTGRYPNRSEVIRQGISDLLADLRDRPRALADGGEE